VGAALQYIIHYDILDVCIRCIIIIVHTFLRWFDSRLSDTCGGGGFGHVIYMNENVVKGDSNPCQNTRTLRKPMGTL